MSITTSTYGNVTNCAADLKSSCCLQCARDTTVVSISKESIQRALNTRASYVHHKEITHRISHYPPLFRSFFINFYRDHCGINFTPQNGTHAVFEQVGSFGRCADYQVIATILIQIQHSHRLTKSSVWLKRDEQQCQTVAIAYSLCLRTLI